MSALITHVVLAEKIFEKYCLNGDGDRRSFILGTCFPDIRYLGVIDRTKTHFEGLGLDDLKGEEPFVAGLKLHSIVDNDMNRRFMKESNLSSFFPADFRHAHGAVKIFEDIVLYEKIKDWDRIISYFDMVLDKEIWFGVSYEAVVKWHQRLQKYFSQKPDKIEFVLDIFDREKDAIEVMEAVSAVEDNEGFRKIVEKYYYDFETIIGE